MTEVTDSKTPSHPARNWLATKAANTLRYSLMNIFIIAGMACIANGGWLTWTGFHFSFFLVGYVDELFGDAGDKELMPPVWYMQLMLYLTLPLLIILSLVVFNVVSETGWPAIDAAVRFFGIDPDAARQRSDFSPEAGAIVSLGMYYGMAGINVGHELIHRTGQQVDYIVGRWLLAFTWDTGFAIEHVYGHHKNVGTELDPATARRGEYIFAFLARSTIGQIRSAHRHERDRLRRRGIPDRPWTNRFWRGQLMTLAVIALFTVFFGWVGILLSLAAAAVGKTYLEVVNYIEHYGLVRIPGTPVESRHAWDSYRRVSSGMFYNLQLHAHHHKVASRKFWELHQSNGEAPVLPYGYMGSILLALIPGLWPRISRRLLEDWDRRLASPAEREYLKSKGTLLGDVAAG